MFPKPKLSLEIPLVDDYRLSEMASQCAWPACASSNSIDPRSNYAMGFRAGFRVAELYSNVRKSYREELEKWVEAPLSEDLEYLFNFHMKNALAEIVALVMVEAGDAKAG